MIKQSLSNIPNNIQQIEEFTKELSRDGVCTVKAEAKPRTATRLRIKNQEKNIANYSNRGVD